MGKLEKKIRKRIQAGQEDFGTWFEKHGDDFPGAGFAAEPEERGAEKVKAKQAWLIAAAFVLAALCVVLCFLPMMLQKEPPVSHFGDESVYERVLEDSEKQKVFEEYPFLYELTYTGGAKLVKADDESLVFIIMSCELETVTDYYFVTVQIEYNSYYDFLSKQSYENLQQQTEINGYSVRYDLLGLDADELNWYRMLTEKNGQKIYWEIHCFEESITEFIDLVLG